MCVLFGHLSLYQPNVSIIIATKFVVNYSLFSAFDRKKMAFNILAKAEVDIHL